jgi:C1A family cysteine protease
MIGITIPIIIKHDHHNLLRGALDLQLQPHPTMAYSLGFLLVAILVCACALSAQAARDLAEDRSMVARHEEWMARYGRVYSDHAEKARRLEVFKTNVAFIESVNSGTDKFWLEANQFADITEDEFKATYTGYKSPVAVGGNKRKTTGFKYANVSLDALPTSVDWRTKGAVTPIKDQGQCGKLIFKQLRRKLDLRNSVGTTNEVSKVSSLFWMID